MALAYSRVHVTRDLDAVFEPKGAPRTYYLPIIGRGGGPGGAGSGW
jgi:hypothetical protein